MPMDVSVPTPDVHLPEVKTQRFPVKSLGNNESLLNHGLIRVDP